MFDLRNKNIHVGSQKVLKGYLGTNLLYSTVSLVFPDPPTEYTTTDLSRAFFYGAGEENLYYGSGSIPLSGDYSLETNGLRLNGGKMTFMDHWASGSGGNICITIENNFDHIPPGGSETILELKNASDFGGTRYNRVSKNANGEVSIFGHPAPETDFVHIYIAWENGDSYGNSYTGYKIDQEMDIVTNGEYSRRKKSTSRNAKIRYMQNAFLTGNILIYDVKYYSRFNGYWAGTPNYNGIKDLPFVRTDQL